MKKLIVAFLSFENAHKEQSLLSIG